MAWREGSKERKREKKDGRVGKCDRLKIDKKSEEKELKK